jgi:uncharacterized membrane protein YagU involved in acid resistance
MEERLFIGVLGGIIAGILKDIPDAFFYYGLKITNITFLDYAGVIVLGHRPRGMAEYFYSIIFEAIFSILLGIIFVYFTTRLEAKHYLLWGAYYGAIVWFAIRAAVLGLNIRLLADGHILTAFINSLDSIIYGMILGYIIRYMEKKEKLLEKQISD